MKLIISALCGLFLAVIVSASPFEAADTITEQRPAICAKGSQYWCQSFPNAKECGAMKHCIQAVWEKQSVPVDNDSICKICLDMVGQARDQLRSNETQEDLKEVFEGTCEIIRIKKIRTECDKVVDDFVPELVEALSSQMNPQVVCSVAGLCNNVAIDRQLAGSAQDFIEYNKRQLLCNNCGKISNLISTRFKHTDRDHLLENMLSYCGKMSSFSDGCSNIVLSYFSEIYSHLSSNLNKENICHMSGMCSHLYHQHEESSEEDSIESSEVGFSKGDDIPCDLCKQLVTHLRDVLTANTTETEFKQVLEGICKQTHSFKAECLSIADEYYDKIYESLTKDLDPEGACFLIGICPKGLRGSVVNAPAMPLLPVNTAQQMSQRKVLGADEPQFSAQQIQSFQLPIDKLMFGGEIMQFQRKTGDTQFCALCEYFLHFVQEALASPKNEENIKNSVAHSCARLPKSIVGECQGFVSQYGDAVIALLIQDIDPAVVCPRLNVCARTYSNEECPLCLFIYEQVEAVIENNRTKENIKDKLNTLCDHLPASLKTECSEFIAENAEALIDNLIKKYPAQEACVILHMCTPKQEMLINALGSKRTSMAIETNEIEDNTIDGIESNVEISTPECLLCQQLIKEVEKKAANDKSRAHIEEVLEHACESLPKANLRAACITAVKKNSDYVINAIIKNVTPKEICAVLAFCAPIPRPPGNDPQCVLCELVMEHFEKELANKKNIEEIEQTFMHICGKLPKTVTKNCETFVKEYAEFVINVAAKVPPKQICTEISLCRQPKLEGLRETQADVLQCAVCHAAADALSGVMKSDNSTDRVRMADKTCNVLPAKYVNKCVKFMNIYFESLHNLLERNVDLATICEQVGMCFKNEASVTLGDNEMPKPDEDEAKPKKAELVGANKCTYGPSYWCHNPDNMNECNAHEFCLKKYKAVKLILT